MSTSDIAVSVRGLSKSYTIAHQGEKHVTLAESLLAKARRPFARAPKETFWALKDVEFDIKKGDVVGIIGRNGAGKSTLLKILSRITEPTTGQIDLYGRVGSLLEVGTGFHPELTGRENIFLNGAILGMSKAEIRKQFDAIVDFAGVEQFLDTPVKRYSSGMYVRLAFAVAAHLESEILIVDEVLAVGDAEFQKKCLGKIKQLSTSGRTVVLVSHDQRSVSDTCTRTIVLGSGRIVFAGPVKEAFEYYTRSRTPERPVGRTYGSNLSRFAEIVDPVLEKSTYFADETVSLAFTIRQKVDFLPIINGIAEIVNHVGQTICTITSRQSGVIPGYPECRVEFHLSSPRLRPGKYAVNISLEEPEALDRIENALSFEVLPPRNQPHCGFRLLSDPSIVLAEGTCAATAPNSKE